MHHDDFRFDFAISYHRTNSWIARELHAHLIKRGATVYWDRALPDLVGGRWRERLKSIYFDSSINLLLWSEEYSNEPNGSFVGNEHRWISDRHSRLADDRSLVILLTDRTPLRGFLRQILGHSLCEVGLDEFCRVLWTRFEEVRPGYRSCDGVFHPLNTDQRRGILRDCTFRIHPSYAADPLGRWAKLGDILLECRTALANPYVYLIPSGACSPLLRHTLFLREFPDLLKRKQVFSRRFVDRNQISTLCGYWFAMRVVDPIFDEVSTVYCPDYDRYLNLSLEKQVD